MSLSVILGRLQLFGLVVAALWAAYYGAEHLTQATEGAGVLALACFVAVLARITQAGVQHEEMTSRLRQLQAVPSTLRSAPAPPAASHEPAVADTSPDTAGDAQRDPVEQRKTRVPVVLLKREVK